MLQEYGAIAGYCKYTAQNISARKIFYYFEYCLSLFLDIDTMIQAWNGLIPLADNLAYFKCFFQELNEIIQQENKTMLSLKLENMSRNKLYGF